MEPLERKVTYKKVIVTEVTNELHFYGQSVETGKTRDRQNGRQARRVTLDMVKKVKASSYIAQYPVLRTVQSA